MIGLEPFKGIKVQCGVAAWINMLCMQPLHQQIFLRMSSEFGYSPN